MMYSALLCDGGSTIFVQHKCMQVSLDAVVASGNKMPERLPSLKIHLTDGWEKSEYVNHICMYTAIYMCVCRYPYQ